MFESAVDSHKNATIANPAAKVHIIVNNETIENKKYIKIDSYDFFSLRKICFS